MEKRIVNEMLVIIDEYIKEEELNRLIKTFIEDKRLEGFKWSDITRLTFMMLGGGDQNITRNAALTELIMLALDIMDDLQDQDNTSKPWMTNPQEYVLNAMLSLVVAFMGKLAGGSSHHKVSAYLAAGINGQQRDINRSVQSEEEYVRMISLKSGSLMQLACYMGYSLIDHLQQEQIERMDALASCLGAIAQLQNDLNDLLRYDLKNDLLHKKYTLPIIFLLEGCDEEFPVLRQFYNGDMPVEEFIQHKQACIHYIHESGCIEYTKVIQLLYIDRAEELWASLPGDCTWKNQFKEATFGIKQASQLT